jgi:hypothetical protein
VAQNAKTVSNCLVQSLNREFHTDNKLSMSITYKIENVELDRVYEVRPQQLLIVGGEPYFVRVTAGQATTRVELFAVWTMVRQLSRPIEMCV